MDMIINSGVVVDSYQSSLGAYGGANKVPAMATQAAWNITINSGGVVEGSISPNDPAHLSIVPTPVTYTTWGI